MAILKANKYEEKTIHKFDFITVEQDNPIKTTKDLSCTSEDYKKSLEEAKTSGYQKGKEEGFKAGYEEGSKLLEEEKIQHQQKLNEDKEAFKRYLQIESVDYINNFRKQMLEMIVTAMDKIFHMTIDDEKLMSIYLSEMISSAHNIDNSIKISCNERTNNVVKDKCNELSIEIIIDNMLEDYDIKIINAKETTEYFLREEYSMLKELFK